MDNYTKWIYFISSICVCLSAVNSSEISKELEFSTNDCRLMEPLYNYTFDFNKLHSDLAHKIDSDKGDTFEFNVCGSLTKNCGNHSNIAACLNRKGIQYVLGVNQKLVYKNGKIYFSFVNGQECKNGENYSLNVILSCDYTLDTKLFAVKPYKDDDCSFYIKWDTPYACLPGPDNVKSNSCLVEDKKNGHTYNLLALSESNHRTHTQNGSYFLINVCKPVLYGQDAMCPPGSSICYVDSGIKNSIKKFYNYGTVQPNPIIENGKLLMRHSSDMICNSTHNITSTIYFSCDKTISDGNPDFIREKECEFEFRWDTSLACMKIQPCTVIDPKTEFKYDFNSLSKKNYVTQSKDGKNYRIGICSDAGNPCLETSGICEYKNDGGKSVSLGKTNNQLHINETGAPYLLYESGEKCEENKNWITKIEFMCNNNNNNDDDIGISGHKENILKKYKKTNIAKIIENSKCQMLIQFETELACQKQITCKAKGYMENNEIDLTPLISTTQNYVALVNESLKLSNNNSVKFFLNVCRPLVPEYELGCSGGSAACRTFIGANNTPEQEKSLGYPDISLTSIEKSRAVLKYLKGDKCETDIKTQLSSSIEFYCDHHAGKGRPILQSIVDDCYYQFYWPTSVICTSHPCKFNNNTCEIINDQLNQNFNLRMENFMNNGKLMINENSQSIDICNAEDMVVITDYSHNMTKLVFNTKEHCENGGSINVELRLVCSVTEHRSSSNDKSLCTLKITLETPKICNFLGIDSIKSSTIADIKSTTSKTTVTGTTITTTTTSSSTTTTTTTTTVASTAKTEPTTTTTTTQKSIIDNKINNHDSDKINNNKVVTTIGIILSLLTITLIVCFWVLRDKTRRKKIKRWFQKSTPRVQYSRVETNEEGNVLLLQEGHITDSDEELLT